MATAKAKGQSAVKNELKSRCEGAAEGTAIVVGAVEQSRGSTKWVVRKEFGLQVYKPPTVS